MPNLASETWTGADGAAWPAQWTSTLNNSTTATIQANAGRLTFNTNSGYNYGALTSLSGMSAATVATDVTLRISFSQVTAESYFWIGVRKSGSFGSTDNGYYLNLAPSASQASVLKHVSGAETNISGTQAIGAWTAGTYRRVRFRAVGNTIQFKIWADGTAEPAAWTWTGTDSALATSGGQVFLGTFGGSAANASIGYATLDDLAVTDGGIAFIGTPTTYDNAGGAGTATLLVNAPAGIVAGELLVAWLALGGTSGSISAAPSGWNLLKSITDNGNALGGAATSIQGALYYKWATASEPTSYTWTTSAAGTKNAVTVFRVTGVGAFRNSGAISYTGANATSFAAPAVAVNSGDVMLNFWAVGDNTPTNQPAAYTVPSGFTPIFNRGVSSKGTAAVIDNTVGASTVPTLSGGTAADTWVAASLVLAPVSTVAMSTFTDDFSTADGTKWYFDTGATVSGGQLSITTTPTYYTASGVGQYNLTGSSASVRLVQRPNVGNGSTEDIFFLGIYGDSGAHRLSWDLTGSNLVATRKVAGTQTTIATLTYSATAHQGLRIREASGTIYWETFDGTTWTQQGSWVTSGLPITALSAFLSAGYWGTEPTPGTAIWDDFNLVSSAPTFVASYAPAAATSDTVATTTLTGSITCAAGDLLLVTVDTGNRLVVPAGVSGGGLTWTQVSHANAAAVSGNSDAAVYAATATSAQTFTATVTVTDTASAGHSWIWQCQRWSNAHLTGITWQIPGSTTGQLSFTTSVANAALALTISDYNTVNGASRTYVTASAGALTETQYGVNGTGETVYSGYYRNAGAAGSKTVGISAPTGTLDAICVVEIAAGASTALNRLKLGANTVGLYVGSLAVSKAYIGATQVWP